MNQIRKLYVVSSELIDRLKRASYHLKKSMSELVRDAVDEYLKNLGF